MLIHLVSGVTIAFHLAVEWFQSYLVFQLLVFWCYLSWSFYWNSSVGWPGSVILAVPGTLPSGNSLFGTLPLPSLTDCYCDWLTIFTWDFYLSSWWVCWTIWFLRCYCNVTCLRILFNSTVEVFTSWCCYIHFNFCDGFLLGSVLPVPGTFPFGSIIWYFTWTVITNCYCDCCSTFSPGISTLVPDGYMLTHLVS